MGRLVIYGAGGFASIARTAARSVERPTGFTTDEASDRTMPGFVEQEDIGSDDRVVIAIGSGKVRARIADKAFVWGYVVAPTAVVDPQAVIGPGAIICDFCLVAATARIGAHFQMNYYCDVSHDCLIGDFVTFGPRVCCNGHVEIGDVAYIGAGALLKNGARDKPLAIGRGAVVGMGALVTRDVPDNAVVMGNPAKIVRYVDEPWLR